jgi:hypothetical protein
LGLNTNPGQQVRLLGEGINAHSRLLGTWLKAGILGALPWLYLCYMAVRRLFSFEGAVWLHPVLAVWTLLVCWDTFFSPWGNHEHVMLAAFLTLIAAMSNSPELQARRIAAT